jgi:thioredoxin reductase (NADPH)
MDRTRQQAERFGTEFLTGDVVKVDLAQRPFTLTLEGGETVTGDTLIVASGATARYLGMPSETKYRGKGVSACATCDGFFYRGKPVAVVGGGDTALEEALHLAHFATAVTLIHRRGELRASKYMQERAHKDPKLSFAWHSVVAEVLGAEGKGVTGVRLRDVRDGSERTLAVDGLFIAIGHQPNTAVFHGLLEMDEVGYLKVTPGSTRTSVAGVFAAGDVADPVYRQAITAAGTGCMAAIEVERFLLTAGA